MKNLFSYVILAVLALTLFSCRNNDSTPVDNDTYPKAIDIQENFVNSTGSTANYLYGIHKNFTSPLGPNDVVLIYRQDNSSGTAVWKLLPKSYFFTQGTLDYHFDFTRNDIQIYADADFNMTTMAAPFQNIYLNGQIFRVVLIPASGKNANVNYEDYESVIRFYKIDESKIQRL